MKKNFNFFIILILLSSCVNKQEKRVIRTVSNFEVLNDDILTKFPGGIYLLNENIVWFDPFTSTHFLYCLDKDTGIETNSFGDIGQGPKEFVSPMINDIVWNNCLYVYDVNGNTNGYFSIDKLKEGNDAFLKLTTEDSVIRSLGYDMRIEDNLYIGINKENENGPFKQYFKGKEEDFGEYLLPNEKKHSNSTVLYNPNKKLLVTGSTAVNYFSCYKKEADNFKLIWENKENYEYSKTDGRIVFDRSRKGIYGMAITKDFIVAIQRDYENDPTDESKVGRDVEKLPRTLFVYDYEGNLLKIIDYSVPVGRIAGDIKTNTIYAIYAEPDFKLGTSLID